MQQASLDGQATVANYYYTRDHLGSIRELVDSTGIIQARYDYDSWGWRKKITGTGIDADFGYTGHYWDATISLNLTYYRAYDPDIGRWLTRDPISERGGVNLYDYVSNQVTGARDPLGLVVPKYPAPTAAALLNVCPTGGFVYISGSLDPLQGMLSVNVENDFSLTKSFLSTINTIPGVSTGAENTVPIGNANPFGGNWEPALELGNNNLGVFATPSELSPYVGARYSAACPVSVGVGLTWKNPWGKQLSDALSDALNAIRSAASGFVNSAMQGLTSGNGPLGDP
jgi:RHS repeat-associated protein